MPYISQKDRRSIHGEVGEQLCAICTEIQHSQDLGQVIFHLVWMYLNRLAQAQAQAQQYPVLDKSIRNLQNQMRRRIRLQDTVAWCNDVGAVLKVHPGHYNYVISYVIHEWLIRIGVSYTHLNRIIGVLDRVKSQFQRELDNLQGHCDEMEVLDDVEGVLVCIQLELYRVLAAPYEDEKMEENGSVSELDDPIRCLWRNIRVLLVQGGFE